MRRTFDLATVPLAAALLAAAAAAGAAAAPGPHELTVTVTTEGRSVTFTQPQSYCAVSGDLSSCVDVAAVRPRPLVAVPGSEVRVALDHDPAQATGLAVRAGGRRVAATIRPGGFTFRAPDAFVPTTGGRRERDVAFVVRFADPGVGDGGYLSAAFVLRLPRAPTVGATWRPGGLRVSGACESFGRPVVVRGAGRRSTALCRGGRYATTLAAVRRRAVHVTVRYRDARVPSSSRVVRP